MRTKQEIVERIAKLEAKLASMRKFYSRELALDEPDAWLSDYYTQACQLLTIEIMALKWVMMEEEQK